MPSYQEVAALIGVKSKNAVFKLVKKLIEEGAISKDKNGRLIPRALGGEIPLLGVVEAGLPSLAEELTSFETISLDQTLVDQPDKTFLLEVKGDSMIEAHIADKDWVLVEQRENAREGEIVIAEVDGEWTMKYLRKKKRKDVS